MIQHDLLTEQYTTILDLNTRLYNGPEYNNFSGTIQLGHPYFGTGKYEPGSVRFENLDYNNVMIRLDLVNEILTVLHPISFISVQLRNPPVDRFTINNQEFIHIRPDSANVAVIRAGFYERLYNGKTQVFERRRKELEERNRGQEIFKEAVERQSYYVLKNRKFYLVKSSKSLLSIYTGKEREIQQHLRKQKLRYKKTKKQAIIESASYFDLITS